MTMPERDKERDERETGEPPDQDDDARVDEEAEESFPASDPPARY